MNNNQQSDKIRLNKYLSNAGIASRRKADDLIKKGQVKVNGNVVTELGMQISKGDRVEYNGKKINPEPFVYILMNKPKNTITTTKDTAGRKTVVDIIKNKVREQVHPVGRLDRDTTGVLLLTNDGELTQKLTHPAYNKKKIYNATLDKPITSKDIAKLTEGFDPGDGKMFFDAVAVLDPTNKKELGIEIHSGRNRIVRRMFEHLGYTVVKLDRVYFAGFTKLGLNRGRWRYLKNHEILTLKKNNARHKRRK